ncbi:MAG: hypothetical protein HKN16_05905, partial [Saprospiraceae bacterium]|nr:hypothetical protein [Saprospiraceae bacterium]
KPVKTKVEPKPSRDINRDQNSQEIAIKRQKEKKRKEELKRQREEALAEQQAQEELDQKRIEVERKRQEAVEAKRLADAEARRKRDAEAQALKDAISSGLSGSGQGSGNAGNPGDQGQPDGAPDGKALEGISTGAGSIGGGLGNRGVLYAPKITNDTQKTGKVVVKVCVDSTGKVVSSNYTQVGSTTNNPGLIATAERSARKYKFTEGTIDRQCGTITIIFKLK